MFAEFEGGTPRSEGLRWDRFAVWSLPPNPTCRDTRLGYTDNGRPLLPGWNEDEWTRLQGLEIFEAFLSAVWSMCDQSCTNALR